MKRAAPTALLFLALLLTATAPALAQPIEREALPAPYTMQGETDPMAMGSAPVMTAPADVPPPINRGEAVIAPPPPGADSLPTQDVEPVTATPPATMQERDLAPAQQQTAPDSPYVNPYPNNPVSGVPPEDPSKFEDRIFCTLKVSFGSMGAGPDRKTGDKVKSYLDSNLDKLSYQTLTRGKEGEFSYCLTIKEHRKQADIYNDLRHLIPDRRNNRAPVSISGKGFEPTGNKRRGTND
ncbi:MAG TPA: hypothetical protein VFS88_04965 [Micavibrio sp.]|nr:hypothetical protein [Micavibrio sp.]